MRHWLRELRNNQGMTQQDVAALVGTAKAVISQWESGTRRPGYDKMVRLAEVLGPEVHEHFAEEARARQDGRVA